ncbi:MAG: PQQ-binding-like beta-propeller repeat protein [Clostridiales bacterium]|jgi:outer membrane protein assembly factor BamB|nr:PQQ-binding-like beta-propeller repeat protein [Clostridiales bacterium]
MRRASIFFKSTLITILCIIIFSALGFALYHSGLFNFKIERNEVETVLAEIPEETPAASPEPTPDPTPEPTPEPTPSPWEIFSPYATEASNPENMSRFRFDSIIDGELTPIHFGMPDEYASGVTTFRGNNFRNSAAWGTVEIVEETLTERYRFGVGGMTGAYGVWTGVGWTGQPSIVKWDYEIQQIMNINAPHRDNEELVEVIQGALDGNIYFFNLYTGEHTRSPIRLGAPIKGAVTVDPRGYPLLYVGQGDSVGGRFGYYIYSLIDGSELFFLNGREATAPRNGWGAFDSNPLFDTANDRMILCGENGTVYNFLLNTEFDIEAAEISIAPVISRYRYNTGRRLGIENSPSAFGNYLFFNDNSGTAQCLDLTTFEPVWVYHAGDDSDSTMAFEWCDEAQNAYLYTATQVDIQGAGGSSYIRRIDASNGTVLWEHSYRCAYNETNGGVTSSPVLGDHDISNLIIYWVAMVLGRGGSGALVAIDRASGEIVWENIFANWGWSSPVAVYTADGTSYLIVSDSAGNMFLLRGTTGEILHQINLGANIEASAAVYDNILVVGTRGQRVYGININ